MAANRRRLRLPERPCSLDGCPRRFVPVRRCQRFHSVWCRRAAWRAAHAPTGRFAPTASTDRTPNRAEASRGDDNRA